MAMDQLERTLLAKLARIAVQGMGQSGKEILEMADRVEYGDDYWMHVYGKEQDDARLEF